VTRSKTSRRGGAKSVRTGRVVEKGAASRLGEHGPNATARSLWVRKPSVSAAKSA
jgi:hypothetical protein